jgi:hypothetical protein
LQRIALAVAGHGFDWSSLVSSHQVGFHLIFVGVVILVNGNGFVELVIVDSAPTVHITCDTRIKSTIELL